MVAVSNANDIRLVIALATMLLFGSVWLAIVVFLRVKKRSSFTHLLFVTLFCIYVYKVLDYTLFQFQSLLLLKYFVPDLMLNGVAAGDRLNLIPLVTLTNGDLKTSLLNILLMMPFGFGLPFIANLSVKRIVGVGALFSIAIELVQLITGLLAQTTFRGADINDVIFNTAGTAIGCVLFVGLARMIPGRFMLPARAALPISFPEHP